MSDHRSFTLGHTRLFSSIVYKLRLGLFFFVSFTLKVSTPKPQANSRTNLPRYLIHRPSLLGQGFYSRSNPSPTPLRLLLAKQMADNTNRQSFSTYPIHQLSHINHRSFSAWPIHPPSDTKQHLSEAIDASFSQANLPNTNRQPFSTWPAHQLPNTERHLSHTTPTPLRDLLQFLKVIYHH
jgi:hypothetical protein